MSFKEKILEFLKYINRFGIPDGLVLFFKIKMNWIQNVKIHGIKYPICLRTNTTDISVFNHIFLRQEYNFKAKLVPSVIIDGGANIGLSSIYFKNRFPEALIIAIEPDKNNFDQMGVNLSQYENIHLKLSGLWNRKVCATANNRFQNGEWGMAIEEVSFASGTTITTVTMDEIIKEFNLSKIDLLKLDIETAEKILFSDNYMNWLPKVKMIIIELHDWIEKGCSKPFFEAINKSFKNYTFEMLGENVIIINEDL